MPSPVTRGGATMTMSDGRVRFYLVHDVEQDHLMVTPGDADSIRPGESPYLVHRDEFTTITLRPAH